ncbi:uncharacterized protein YjbJ (UPF0337 family) [Streptomyces avidinii]|uniref:Uncharacterized protein YjbJ (UPF0337 family) n=1 Tax=Streptomyces avidinii TaxID=1895 RepID=A0ABS4L7B7_STRAV|nr:uncharacterized protein YjbJ (UPF0337 family) [Streptomyces avidinii]
MIGSVEQGKGPGQGRAGQGKGQGDRRSRAVGNESMTAEGRAEKAKGDARQAEEKVKDVFKG